MSAQRFQNQGKAALLPQFVGGLDLQRHHTLKRRLLHRHDAPVADAFAQQHAEHRRLGRVIPQLLRHMNTGLIGIGA